MKAAEDLWQFIRRDADVGARHRVTAPMTWPGRRAGNAVAIAGAPLVQSTRWIAGKT
jgi:hypothetical protein